MIITVIIIILSRDHVHNQDITSNVQLLTSRLHLQSKPAPDQLSSEPLPTSLKHAHVSNMALPTSSGTDVQHANYNPSIPSHNDTNRLNWTPAHEARLTHVQAQLAAAQARWSEEQDLWLDEVGPCRQPNSVLLYPEQPVHPHRRLSSPEAKRSGIQEKGQRNGVANVFDYLLLRFRFRALRN